VSGVRYTVLGILASCIAVMAMILIVPPCGFPDVSCR
jgi:hypothetical protein